MADLLEELRLRADLVLVDTPPVLPLSDAMTTRPVALPRKITATTALTDTSAARLARGASRCNDAVMSAETGSVPATLVEKIEGTVVLIPIDTQDWLRGLAESAAAIHRVEASGFRWKYRRYNDGVRLSVPLWSKQQDAWRRAIEIVQAPPHSYRECFIHRDYHPSNVLWQGGRVSGVVDWVNGCRGPAGIDVAWCGTTSPIFTVLPSPMIF